MGILDMFIINHGNISKGFESIVKGTKYTVAYDEVGKIIAYTVGIDAGKQLMDKYIVDNKLDKKYIKFEDEFHKKDDDFIKENGDFQICIVDKDVVLKKDIKELMKKESLIPDKKNKMMTGLDKYTRES